MFNGTLHVVDRVRDGIKLHKQLLLPFLVYSPSGWSGARDNIAA